MWVLELSNLDLSLGSASSGHCALDRLLNLIFSLALASRLERADPVCVHAQWGGHQTVVAVTVREGGASGKDAVTGLPDSVPGAVPLPSFHLPPF